jgi:hypothetical protein
VTDDPEYAKTFGDETWGKTKDPEKKMKDEQDEAERKKREEEDKKKKEEADDEEEEEEEVCTHLKCLNDFLNFGACCIDVVSPCGL